MRLAIRTMRTGRFVTLLTTCLFVGIFYLCVSWFISISGPLEEFEPSSKAEAGGFLINVPVDAKKEPSINAIHGGLQQPALLPHVHHEPILHPPPPPPQPVPPPAHLQPVIPLPQAPPQLIPPPPAPPEPVLPPSSAPPQPIIPSVPLENNGDYANRVLDSPHKVHEAVLTFNDRLQVNVADITNGEPSDKNTTERRNFVRQMAKQAWDAYRAYAWGHNELEPLTKSPHDPQVLGTVPLGVTILDSIDTLYIMGLMSEYEDAKQWIDSNFTFNGATDVSVFEMTIRSLGSMLTLYSFTKDELFLTKAKLIANELMPAFKTPSSIPYSLINLKTKLAHNYAWANGGCSILADAGTLHMEWKYLSQLTGNLTYANLVDSIRKKLIEASQQNKKGFFFEFINPHTLTACSSRISLSGLSDSFYEYLLKEHIRSGGEDIEARQLYDAQLKLFDEIQLVRTSPQGSLYTSVYTDGSLASTMEHLACFSGGMFALGSQGDRQSLWFRRGENITATCHKAYAKAAAHLGPDKMVFSKSVDAVGIEGSQRHYLLRPETVESYFYLWRLTHDQKYRDWAWDAAQSLERHCYTGTGYSGLSNVYSTMDKKDNVQQSYFIAETLKYLYLIFSDDTLLPLNRWVFNTEAHPLPVLKPRV